MPRFIDTAQAIDEIPSYDSLEPSPDDFHTPLSRWRKGERVTDSPFFASWLTLQTQARPNKCLLPLQSCDHSRHP
jgi:hypothetical protein